MADRYTAYAEDASVFFLRICHTLSLMQTPRNLDVKHVIETCGQNSRPALLVNRRDNEPICGFMRRAQSLAFLFIGERDMHRDANEMPLKFRQITNDTAVVETADAHFRLDGKDMKALEDAYHSGQDLAGEILAKLKAMLPKLGEREEDYYWLDEDDNIVASDIYAANILADLLCEMGHVAGSRYYDSEDEEYKTRCLVTA